MQSDIGLIGLAVMGENLVLNMESKGFPVAVFTRTTAVTEKFAASRGKGKKITPTKTIAEFSGMLKRPCKVMMMIKAGKPVDQMIPGKRLIGAISVSTFAQPAYLNRNPRGSGLLQKS
jgi:6-phosphogluconate dehydrogenase